MRNIAFIFARGGSKGLPRKNIKQLLGKPLIVYSIEKAFECHEIDAVFVSTDDAEISKIARACGAQIINRPSHLASDNSPEWLSWQHAIKYTQDRIGKFDNFVSLPATSPLRSVDDIEKAIAERIATDTDACLGISASHHSPYFNMVTRDSHGFCRLVIPPDKPISRRQDDSAIFNIKNIVYVLKQEYAILEKMLILSWKFV